MLPKRDERGARRQYVFAHHRRDDRQAATMARPLAHGMAQTFRRGLDMVRA